MTELPTAVPEETTFSQLVRQCVQCGLCLPHCATWLATGNEVHSPRGRLVLLGLMQEGNRPESPAVTESFMHAFDQCIGCRACETACPSGVPFTLLEQGQEWAAAWFESRGPTVAPAVPTSILHRMDRPDFLAGLSRVADSAKWLVRALAGKDWRSRLAGGPGGCLARLLGSLPASPRSDKKLIRLLDDLCGFGEATPAGLEPAESVGPRVAFFRGCANAGLLGGSSRRLRGLLAAAGCGLEEPASQRCCGALAAHTGRADRAAVLKQFNREAFAGAMGEGTVILTEAAGCGHELRKSADDFAAAVTDAVVFLSGLDLPPLGKVPLKVAYHDPCHARHGQGVVAEPRTLLAAIPGVETVEPDEPEVCCGSGGAWGLRYPGISGELGLRKAANLVATGADLVVTANPGCLGQIADGLALLSPGLPVLPLTDLLWYAACRGSKQGTGSRSRP